MVKNIIQQVNIATEFNKFKDVLFNEKIIRYKMKRIQSINQELMKLTKYFCHVLAIKDMCQMMEFVCWLIFIKIVSQVVKRFKTIVIVIKKIVIKKIVIIEKDCDD